MNKQKLTFDEEKGWSSQGDVKVSDSETKWKLSGKTFECSESSFGPDFTMSPVFNDSSGEDLSAVYAIVQKTNTSADSAYRDINLTGTATGKPTHKYGDDDFTLALNDADQQVTFKVGTGYSKTLAGFDEVNTLRVDYHTKAAYANFFGHDSYLEGYSKSFTEKLAKDAAE